MLDASDPAAPAGTQGVPVTSVRAMERDLELPVAGEPRRGPRFAERAGSLFEVLACSGFPTQLLIMALLAAAGLSPVTRAGSLSFRYIVVLSLADTALLVGLIYAFLRLRADRPAALFLGQRSVPREIWFGALLAPAALLAVGLLSAAIQRWAPWLRTVPENPFSALIRDPLSVAVFALVAVLAGGLREELQRAFVLDRFERHLGGAHVGLVVFSVAFGLGHVLQGLDAAVLTAMLGAFWGAVYLRRRSVVAPVVCHALFNLAEVLHHAVTT